MSFTLLLGDGKKGRSLRFIHRDFKEASMRGNTMSVVEGEMNQVRIQSQSVMRTDLHRNEGGWSSYSESQAVLLSFAPALSSTTHVHL